MAPKRKAAADPAKSDQPPPPKRATRSSASAVASSSTSNNVAMPDAPPAQPKASTSRAKAKPKQEVIVILSDDDQDDIEIIEPKKKTPAKKPATKKATPAPAPAMQPALDNAVGAKKVPTEKKKKEKGKSSAIAFHRVVSKKKNEPASTTNAPLPEAMLPPPALARIKKSPVKPRAPLSWEEGCKEWFAQFADEDAPTKMGGEGIEKLFDAMGVSMEGALPFILAFKTNAKPGTFGSCFLSDFLSTFRAPKFVANPLHPRRVSTDATVPNHRINSSAALKDYLLSAETSIYASNDRLQKFYSFLFNFVKEEGQKSLGPEIAVALWEIVLAPKFKNAVNFIEYAKSLGSDFKGVSSDVWSQLFDFCATVSEDMNNVSADDAWPSIIDSFVEWKRAQAKA